MRSIDTEECDSRALLLDVAVDESTTDIFASVTVWQPGLATGRDVLRRSKSTEDFHDTTAPPKMQRCTSWDMLSTTIHDLYSVTLMEAHDVMDLTLDTVALHDHRDTVPTGRHYISESHVRAGRQGNSSPNDAADSSKSCFANEGVNEPLVMSACPCHFEQADCKVLEIESAPDEAFTFSAAKPRSYPFITGGYRPAPSSVAQCVASLFALHNETINIWTHISGTIIYAYLLLCLLATGQTAPFSDQVVTGLDMVVISVYIFSGLVCFALSALYHLLTAAQEHIVRIAEKADFAGILTLMLGSNFPMVFFGFSERTDLILFHTVMNIVAILLALAALRHDKAIAYKLYIFLGVVVLGWVQLAHSLYLRGILGRASHELIAVWVRSFLCYAVGIVFYSSKAPEAWLPGRFNILLSSHQIWHVLVLIGSLVHLTGCYELARLATHELN